jgi:hypothetical protein
MLSRRTRLLLLAGGVCAAVLPAVAQPPESGLPPGFGDPKPAPPPTPTPPTTVTPTVPDPNVVPPGFGEEPTPTPPRATTRVERMPIEETTDSALTDLELLPPPPPPPFYDLPKGTERPVDVVGLINITNRGLALDAFGDASGPFLATLMQRLEAPLPSRWGQILLRRALISRVAAPRMLDPVDFVAERVRLLVRMGEADAARMLAQSIDVNSYNPNMVRAGYEAALATADPAGLCPLVRKGRDAFRDPVWPMADAMCAALEGESGRASALLDEARRNGARGPDLLLAEKVIGAGTNTRRAVSIRWEDIPEVNMWRFGLASAAGAIIPEQVLGTGGPRMQAWLARAPMVPIADRLAAADRAATLGVFSSASLVDAHSLAFELRDGEAPQPKGGGEAGEAAADVTTQLRTAFAGADMGARLVALRNIWDEEDGLRRYARLILTAGASRQLPVTEEQAGDADEIVASLLAAGMDGEAAAWAEIVEEQGGSSLAWALLAVGAPTAVVGVDDGRVEDFAGDANEGLRARMLAAALAGLGRAGDGLASGLGVDVGREDGWTQALDRAAAAGSAGTVALLAAVGMQADDWSGVPPEHLYRIMRAMRQVGLEYEARMIAAEALTRL